MKILNNKLLLTPIEAEQEWAGLKEDSVKLGKVAFPVSGEMDDHPYSFDEGEELYYQYGNPVRIDGTEYVLVRISDLVCQK